MPRILLIEDDDNLRNSLRLILGQMGHSVIEARDGAEGLKLYQSVQVDLVITDIMMPEKEGVEVMLALRKGPPTKFIAMSGDRGRLRAADNLHMAKLLGAAQVLEKPFSREVLLTAINSTLSGDRPLAEASVKSEIACAYE